MTKPVETLGDAESPDLRQVQARRRQLNVLVLLVFILLAGGVVLFSVASERLLDRPVGLVDFGILRIGFIALAGVFAFYIYAKERELSRSERALVRERVLSAALSSRLRELSALSQAGRAVSATLSRREVLDVVLRSARELLGATEASVMLLDPETKKLRIAASIGIDQEIARRAEIPVGEGVAGWVVESLEPVVLRGEVNDPRFREVVPKARKLRSAMSAPLPAAGEAIGVLNVSVSGARRDYSDHDLRALTVFAEHAGIAIANARLYEREKATSSALADLEQQRRDFLATMTHDLKTPLTSILGYVKLLRRGESLSPEDMQKFTDVIERQGQRILEMVQQLIVATRLEEGAPTMAREPLDLRKILDEQLAAFGGVLEGRRIDVRFPDDLPQAYGDPSAVEHILGNLLENAMKYSPEDGRIEVAAEHADGEIRVSVTDDGPGIPEEHLPQVFERYHQAVGASGHGSVGLGLFIVRSLAQAHGGQAWAENAPGRGARVWFSLPVRSGA